MYQILDKDTIEMEIIPQIPLVNRGSKISVLIVELINCILYKLKAGIQWGFLSVNSLFSHKVLHPKTVFGHYRNWCRKKVGLVYCQSINLSLIFLVVI